MDNDNAFVDNVFCTAILQILEIPGIFSGSSTIDLDELKYDFQKNGNCDESFYDDDDVHSCNGIYNRKPLVSLQPKAQVNRNGSKKAKKLDKAYGFCKFCENNQEPAHVFNSHSLRDSRGKLACPRLRKYVCPICGASGDNAHTVRYCNKKPIFVMRGTSEVRKVRNGTTTLNKTIRI